ncbi:MAG: serine/threonine-protein kinase [Planctomycetota bacterium]
MPSDESIPTDASTVQRMGERAPLEPANPSVHPEQIAQAKTVIRGSSRVSQPNERPKAFQQTPAEVAKVLLGQRLNHFRLDELIGGGGMGAVFRAHDEQLDRTVAIKVIPFVRDDQDLHRRFRNEAQSAAKLDHPRIARVFDVGNHDEWHYIVFEYIEGTNVRDWVHRNGVLTIDEAVFFTCQLADALQHASERGIVHRDIKPSNVLMGTSGKLKLVDMGLARSDALDFSEDLTASGVTLGTFDYISPEQARDPRDADLRSDLYSLGCTLYFMLTGRPPYPGGTMLQKLLSHGNAPPPNPAEIRPEVSENLVAVIQKMLAKTPDDRYQTATDLVADLREVALRDGLTRSQSLLPVTVTEPNALVQWLEKYAPFAVAITLVLMIGGWLHLDAAASRQELTVPPSAMRPISSSVVPSASSESDVSTELIPPLPPPEEDEDSGVDESVPETESVETEQDSTINETTDPASPAVEDAADPSMADGEAGIDSAPSVIESAVQSEPNLVRIVPEEAWSSGPQLGIAFASSLAEAIDLAATHQVDRIEIATDVLVSGPIELQTDVLITSIVPGGSRVVFRTDEVRSMERTRMLRIGEHQVEFEDLHFVWDVPSREFEGGAMFEVHDNQLVRLTDCTVTVNNPTLNDEVFAFEVITDPDMLSPDRETEVEDFPKVWLELNNVVIRGQMTMLQMDYAAKLMLFWDNGLLAVTERMIDTAGARVEPPADAEPILLSLTYVTIHAPLGVMRSRVGVSGSYVVPVDRSARKSVFWVDPSIPHFEFLGIPTLEPAAPLLNLRGASNAYDVEPTLADPMLRLFAADGEMSVTRMNDLVVGTPEWADDLRPSWEVDWQTEELAEIPANLRTPEDYLQDDLSPSGFDGSSLPPMTRQSPAPEPVSPELSPEEL